MFQTAHPQHGPTSRTKCRIRGTMPAKSAEKRQPVILFALPSFCLVGSHHALCFISLRFCARQLCSSAADPNWPSRLGAHARGLASIVSPSLGAWPLFSGLHLPLCPLPPPPSPANGAWPSPTPPGKSRGRQVCLAQHRQAVSALAGAVLSSETPFCLLFVSTPFFSYFLILLRVCALIVFS